MVALNLIKSGTLPDDRESVNPEGGMALTAQLTPTSSGLTLVVCR